MKIAALLSLLLSLFFLNSFPVLAVCGKFDSHNNNCGGTADINPYVRCGFEYSVGGEVCCNTLDECANSRNNPANKPAESDGIASSYLNSLNTQIGGKYTNTNLISGVLSDALNYALVIAGLILLFMLISGGFTLLTNPTNPQAQEGGKQRLTWAVAGFILLFSSYWIVQILEIIFKVEIV